MCVCNCHMCMCYMFTGTRVYVGTCMLTYMCVGVPTCACVCMHMHAGYMGLQCTEMQVCCMGVRNCFCVHVCLFTCVRLIPKPVCPAVWAYEGLGLPRSLVWIVRDPTFLPDTLLSLFQLLGEADTRWKFPMQGHTLRF